MKQKTCAEVAAELATENVSYLTSPDWCYYIDKFKQCSDFPKPKKTKQVWQWRSRDRRGNGQWLASLILKTEDEAKEFYQVSDYAKLAGPYEVEVE